MNGTLGEARSPLAQRASQLYNDVQVCREMGWTQVELEATDDEFVWAALQVMSLEGEKMESDRRAAENGGRAPGGIQQQASTQPGAPMNSHRASSRPIMVPD